MQDTIQQIKQTKAFKVIIVGPQSVGKSSLLCRLADSTFNGNYMSTVGIDFKSYECQVGLKQYSLQLWDTAGQEKFRALTSTYYKGSQGCLCVFDLSNKETLDKCQYYLQKALDQNISKNCIFLIGNKEDIGGDIQKGQNYAEQYGVRFFTASAKEDTGVKQAFQTLAEHLVQEFGDKTQKSYLQLKPNVNISESKSKCCGS